jgi:hypothetical protein
MESNGEPSKIHVSKSTADLLVASGKGHWLTPRDEKVMAKGKGLLQTYWCEPKVGGSGGTSREFSVGATSNSNSGGGSGTESVIGEDELLVIDPSLDDKANTINADTAVTVANSDNDGGNVCHESFTANSEETA